MIPTVDHVEVLILIAVREGADNLNDLLAQFRTLAGRTEASKREIAQILAPRLQVLITRKLISEDSTTEDLSLTPEGVTSLRQVHNFYKNLILNPGP
jgi:hypothetical protein